MQVIFRSLKGLYSFGARLCLRYSHFSDMMRSAIKKPVMCDIRLATPTFIIGDGLNVWDTACVFFAPRSQPFHVLHQSQLSGTRYRVDFLPSKLCGTLSSNSGLTMASHSLPSFVSCLHISPSQSKRGLNPSSHCTCHWQWTAINLQVDSGCHSLLQLGSWPSKCPINAKKPPAPIVTCQIDTHVYCTASSPPQSR